EFARSGRGWGLARCPQPLARGGLARVQCQLQPLARALGTRTPHEILGVQPGENAQRVREAYLRAALRHHPDRNPGSAQAADKFREVARAFETLSAETSIAREPEFEFATAAAASTP
ncbi:DnaJ domain-containing protein, partial [Pavlovales sp. CCMP2436]